MLVEAFSPCDHRISIGSCWRDVVTEEVLSSSRASPPSLSSCNGVGLYCARNDRFHMIVVLRVQ